MSDENKSQMRVFLSADLVGSTKLKNRLNHQTLLEKYRSRRHVIQKLRTQDGNLQISEEVERAAVLESLAVSTDDFDWSTVVRAFYEDMHSGFVTALKADCEGTGVVANMEHKPFEPWKAVGDELIYAIPVQGRRELYSVTVAFLRAIRELDIKLGNRSEGGTAALRIKGAAWVAGFPVRNREIKLPPNNRPDFLGPEMDTGFRIAKCTKSGMLVVSVEMAELLGENMQGGQSVSLSGQIVGWVKLKGVWNDLRYPVIWVDFPNSHRHAEDCRATPFTLWDQEESIWCKRWSSTKPEDRESLFNLAVRLREIRIALPPSLGIVDPYIVKDELHNEPLPKEHTEILDLLRAIETHRQDANRHEVEDLEAPSASSIDSDVAQVSGLLDAAKQNADTRVDSNDAKQ